MRDALARVVLMLGIFISALGDASSGFLGFGYGSGGENLADTTGGTSYSTNAGAGLYMMGGILLPVSPTFPHAFEAQLGVGYIFQEDARSGEGHRTRWSRIPIEAIYFYHNTRENFRIGWGATYHIAGRLAARGDNAVAETNVDNALGYVVSIERILPAAPESSTLFSFGIKYVDIDYYLVKFDKSVSANSFYFTFSSINF